MLIRAGERAASLARAGGSPSVFRACGRVERDATERAGLLERAGLMASQMGHLEQAMTVMTEAQRLFAESEQWHPAARIEAELGDILFEQGHLDLAIDAAARVWCARRRTSPTRPSPW